MNPWKTNHKIQKAFSSDGVSAVYNVFHNFLERKPNWRFLSAETSENYWVKTRSASNLEHDDRGETGWSVFFLAENSFRCEWSCWWKRPEDRNMPFSTAAACSGVSLHRHQDLWLRFFMQVSSYFLKCFYRWILIFCHWQLRDQRKHHPTHSKQTPD